MSETIAKGAKEWLALSWELAKDPKDLGGALEAATKAMELAPGEPTVAFRLGLLRAALKSFLSAAEAFEACEVASMEMGELQYLDAARLAASHCWLNAGEIEKARKALSGVSREASVWVGELLTAEDLRRSIQSRS